VGVVKKKQQYQPNFEWHKGFKWVNYGTEDKPVLRKVQHIMKDINKGSKE
jgi:hypothetical protein